MDGSYLLIEEGKTLLYGEAYRLADGELRQISEENEVLALG